MSCPISGLPEPKEDEDVTPSTPAKDDNEDVENAATEAKPKAIGFFRAVLIPGVILVCLQV